MTPTPTSPSAARRRRHDQIARAYGVRTVSRPLADGGSFDLAYTRSGQPGGTPVLVLPGGPGLASVLPYQRWRVRAAKAGLDVVMVEHRGVGLSRTAAGGEDLPRESMSITEVLDDAAAVLDAEGIAQVLVLGSSYGSYLAQGFGARHPGRVAGMVLDSAMLRAGFATASTAMLRDLFWAGTPATAQEAEALRSLVAEGVVDAGEAGFPLQLLYEVGGAASVGATLELLRRGRGRRFWRWLRGLGADEVMTPKPFAMEFDLAGEIAFRELDYAPPSDGGPLQTSDSFTRAAEQFSPFSAEPFDLAARLPAFSWPTVVVSGDRDVRTPRATAEEIVSLVPGAVLLPVRDHGHSALDTHPRLALEVVQAVARSVETSQPLAAAGLPVDPSGTRGVMQRVVGARLALARVAPGALS